MRERLLYGGCTADRVADLDSQIIRGIGSGLYIGGTEGFV